MNTDNNIYVANVTAAQADTWLRNNTDNRRLRTPIVEAYAADMLAGRWLFAGDAIRFDTDGRLVDGQHRCAAVILAAETDPTVVIPMLVIRGLSPAAQAVMDSGISRNAADHLARHGFTYGSCVAAATRLILWHNQPGGLVAPRHQHRNASIIDYAMSHPELDEYAQLVYRKRTLFHPSVPVAGQAIIFPATSDETGVTEFFERLANGANLRDGDPILALRNRLMAARMSRETITNRVQLILLLRVWNASRNGDSLRKFPVRVRGKLIPPGDLAA